MALLKGKKSALLMLYILAVSSAEFLNEIPINSLYQEGNDLGVESPPLDERVGYEYGRRHELLYKLMNPLHRNPVISPRYQEEGNMDEAKATWSLLPGVKERRFKRWLGFFDSSTIKPQSQRKLNSKKPKGKWCLLKLCAFRKLH